MSAVKEEIITPDVLGVVSNPNELAELQHFKPPGKKKLQTNRRIMQLCFWVMNQHRIVQDWELASYAQLHYNIEEAQAKRYVTEVAKVFERKGFLVIRK